MTIEQREAMLQELYKIENRLKENDVSVVAYAEISESIIAIRNLIQFA